MLIQGDLIKIPQDKAALNKQAVVTDALKTIDDNWERWKEHVIF